MSLSSSSSSGPNIPVAEPQVAKPLHFKSESEASEATDAPNKKKRAMDEDVSGPEMDDIDDFWNWWWKIIVINYWLCFFA